MQVDIPKLTAANGARWRAMAVDPGRVAEIDRVVARLWTPESIARYAVISKATGVPSPFIALAHERESSQNWTRSLAQGDSLARRSVNVPAGRIPPPAEPPFTFEAAAIDALVACDHVDKWTDWTIAGLLTKLELWNGAGYYFHGLPSAYVWAGSTQYLGGKYDTDGHFNPALRDQQLGVAVLFARMLFCDADLRNTFTLGVPDDTAVHPAAVSLAPPPAAHDTTWVQQQLNALAQREPYGSAMAALLGEFDPPGSLPLVVDGDYGRVTKQAVRAFQRAHGDLLDDGKAGPATQDALQRVIASA